MIDKKVVTCVMCIAITTLVGCCYTLDYDDGTFEDSSSACIDMMLLNEFTAPYEAKINSIEWWVDSGFGWEDLFELVILDSGRNIIWTHRVRATEPGWNRYKLEDRVLVNSGTFYVGARWLHPTCESVPIGWDLSDPDNKSWVVYGDGTWILLTDKDYPFKVIYCDLSS